MRHIRKPPLPGTNEVGPSENPIAWCGFDWGAHVESLIKKREKLPTGDETPYSSIDEAIFGAQELCSGCAAAVQERLEARCETPTGS